MRKAILLAFVIAAQPAFANSLTYIGAKTFADRDTASLSKAQAKSLGDAEEAVISHVMDACRSNRLQPFVVVMKLDSSGTVLETWHHYDSDMAVCFEKNLIGVLLFVPPHAPFYTSIERSFSQ